MTTEETPGVFVPSDRLFSAVNLALSYHYDHVADIVRSEAEGSAAPQYVSEIAHLEIMAAFARFLGLSYDDSIKDDLYRRYIRAVEKGEDGGDDDDDGA